MGAQTGAVLRIGERKLDKSTKVALEIADVEARFARGKPQPYTLSTILEDPLDRVGELNLATFSWSRRGEFFKDRGTEHISGCDRQVAGRLVNLRLFDDPGEFKLVGNRATRLGNA